MKTFNTNIQYPKDPEGKNPYYDGLNHNIDITRMYRFYLQGRPYYIMEYHDNHYNSNSITVISIVNNMWLKIPLTSYDALYSFMHSNLLEEVDLEHTNIPRQIGLGQTTNGDVVFATAQNEINNRKNGNPPVPPKTAVSKAGMPPISPSNNKRNISENNDSVSLNNENPPRSVSSPNKVRPKITETVVYGPNGELYKGGVIKMGSFDGKLFSFEKAPSYETHDEEILVGLNRVLHDKDHPFEYKFVVPVPKGSVKRYGVDDKVRLNVEEGPINAFYTAEEGKIPNDADSIEYYVRYIKCNSEEELLKLAYASNFSCLAGEGYRADFLNTPPEYRRRGPMDISVIGISNIASGFEPATYYNMNNHELNVENGKLIVDIPKRSRW